MALAPPATAPERIAWRQSLGAGLLLGLALGCAWLAHWAPQLRARLALVALALVLTLLGLGLMFSLAEKRRTQGGWRRWHTQFAAGAPFFSVLAVLTLAATVTGNNLLYLIVSGLLAMVIISGVVSALNLSGMELRFRLPEDLYAGRPVPVGFTLTNAKGFWPAYSLTVAATSRPLATAPAAAALEVAMPPIYFFYLPRRDHISAESVIQFPGRGRYTSAAFVLATRFPFGLMRKWRRFQSDGREPELLVYPAPVAPTHAALAQLRAGARVVRHRRGDGQDLYRVRPHQLGDSARQVHWKASARAGALRVREFSDESGSRLRLRLALPSDLPPERAEAALSLCAGWLLALLDPAAAPTRDPDLWLEFLGENGVYAQPHLEAARKRHEQSGRPLPPVEARPQATSGSDPAKSGEPHGLWLPLAPAHLHRRAILNYLAVVDPARWAPPPVSLDPDLAELTITGGEAQLGAAGLSVSNRSADAGRSG